jgi:hypothetical protein
VTSRSMSVMGTGSDCERPGLGRARARLSRVCTSQLASSVMFVFDIGDAQRCRASPADFNRATQVASSATPVLLPTGRRIARPPGAAGGSAECSGCLAV